MSCHSFIPDLDCHIDRNEMIEMAKRAIEKLTKECPDAKPIVDWLATQEAVLESISYAGNGCFLKNGDYSTERVTEGFDWQIKYHYNQHIFGKLLYHYAHFNKKK